MRDCSPPICFKLCQSLLCVQSKTQVCTSASFCVALIYGTGRNCCSIHNICICFPVSVRDLGMVPYIKIFLDQDQYRGPTLNILEQLAEINPEEFMSTAIGALCSSTQQELGLKRDLLQVITVHVTCTHNHRQQHTHIQKHSDLQFCQLNCICSLHSTSNHNKL